MTTYYVTTSGSDSNAGTSEALAFASPGKAMSVAVSGDDIWVKLGTYSIANGAVNTSGQAISMIGGVAMRGYSTTIGDGGRPTLQAGTTGMTVITSADNQHTWVLENFIIDGNNGASNNGVYFDTGSRALIVRNVKAVNCPGVGIHVGWSGGSSVLFCEAANCGKGFESGEAINNIGCVAHGCTVGFYRPGICIRCISYANTSHGFQTVVTNPGFIECTAYGNGGHGIYCSDFSYSGSGPIVNCISYGNTGYGVKLENSAGTRPDIYRTAIGGNLGGTVSTTTWTGVADTISLTSNPFTDATGGDFSLNNISGGGAACRGAGILGSFPGISTVGYPDIGAVQHQDRTSYSYTL